MALEHRKCSCRVGCVGRVGAHRGPTVFRGRARVSLSAVLAGAGPSRCLKALVLFLGESVLTCGSAPVWARPHPREVWQPASSHPGQSTKIEMEAPGRRGEPDRDLLLRVR